MMRRTVPLLIAVMLLPLASWVSAAGPAHGSLVIVGKYSGTVSGAMYDYVSYLLDTAAASNASLLVLELNTPGGSLDAALRIVDLLKRSPVPVAVYVVDRWAMSAGTMIFSCADIAAMQPGTLIGAVQPVIVTGSGGFTPVNESKILNPVYKTIELCLRMHDRNYTVAKAFVYRNLVLTAEEAVRLGVADVEAATLQQLLDKVNGTLLARLGVKLVLQKPVRLVEYSMPPGLQVAQLLSDPLVSSLISSIAMLVILLGLASGHPLVAVLGFGLLLLGLYGLGLSASLVSIALILVGFSLLLVELLLIPGFGVVGVTGIVLLAVGTLVLFSGKPLYIAPENLQAAMKILVSVTAPLAGLMAIAVYKVFEARRRAPMYNVSIVGRRGRALDRLGPGDEGFIMVEGEYWRARNVGDEPVERGDTVRVVGKEGPVLLVVREESGGGRQSSLRQVGG